MSAPQLQPELDAGLSELDLIDEQGLVDRVVEAVGRDDLREVLYWVRRLEERGKVGELNSGHSVTSLPPLIAACTKDPSRTRSIIIRILAAKGCKIPVQGDSPEAAGSEWMEDIRAEQIALAEGGGEMEGDDEENVRKLLVMSEADAEAWIASNLPPPQAHERPEGVENQIDPYDDAMRASSMPADYHKFSRLGADDSGHVLSSPAPRSPYSSRPHGFKKESPTSARTGTTPQVSSNNVIDLTLSRSPSPVPKEEDPDSAALAGPSSSSRPAYRSSASGSKRHRSRSPSADRDREHHRRARPRSRSPGDDVEDRAHLRLDHIPSDLTVPALEAHLAALSVQGVTTVQIPELQGESAKAWALVSFSSLSLAQVAYLALEGKEIGGMEPELKIYSAAKDSVEPLREVRPPGAGANGQANGAGAGGGGGAGGNVGYGRVYGDGGRASGGGGGGGGYRQNGPLPPQDQGPFRGGGGRGGYGNGPPNGGGGGERYFPRPRPPPPPIIFTAAELARRVYCGSLRFGTTQDEVQELFSQRAGVVARVMRVMNAPDGSHAFAFIQLPDAITADHALKTLHGTVHDGHLLQVERVNELGHRWLFSLSLHNLPLRWQYRDVSDFLVSVIGNFAGLIVRRSYYDERLEVRVELRYSTEVRWSCSELNGLIVDGKAIEAVIDQPKERRQYEREMSYKRLVDDQYNNANAAPASGAQGYDPAQPSAAYNNAFPSLSTTNDGGATPSGSRRVPPPPPPPPPAGMNGGSMSPQVSASTLNGGASQASSTLAASTAEPEEYNPFAPAFMLRK
ncbi:hypothetical protein JCM6882_009358 [Rhodosporidiobolus microsporus]